MRYFYKQDLNDVGNILRVTCGIDMCFLVRHSLGSDWHELIKNVHRHAFYETHIVVNGYMDYEINGVKVRVDSGGFLLIPPLVSHKAVGSGEDCVKYGLAFSFLPNTQNRFTSVFKTDKAMKGKACREFCDCLAYCSDESAAAKPFSDVIISNRVFEMIVYLARSMGLDASSAPAAAAEDVRLTLAKSYIEDNICGPLTASDAASFCHISEKQLSRLFLRCEGVTVSRYIRECKAQKAKKLVLDPEMSLLQISRVLGFGSEYYFNAFFKKHVGASPGKYRREHRQLKT